MCANFKNKKNLIKIVLTSIQSSGSQTFLVRGPLRKTRWSAKKKILIYIGICKPLKLISRTTSGPRSRLWESLHQRLTNISIAGYWLIYQTIILGSTLKPCLRHQESRKNETAYSPNDFLAHSKLFKILISNYWIICGKIKLI